MRQGLEVTFNGSHVPNISHRQNWVRALLMIMVAFAMLLLTAHAKADMTPTSFEFRFRGASPGMRFWTNQGDIWTETYSSGQKSTFRVKKYPFHVNGLTGTLVQKVDETDFFVFISDIHESKMEVWTNKAKDSWLPLAKPSELVQSNSNGWASVIP